MDAITIVSTKGENDLTVMPNGNSFALLFKIVNCGWVADKDVVTLKQEDVGRFMAFLKHSAPQGRLELFGSDSFIDLVWGPEGLLSISLCSKYGLFMVNISELDAGRLRTFLPGAPLKVTAVPIFEQPLFGL